MPLNSGEVLQNRYRITGPLGQGGMGAVLGTVDQDIRRKVAMKVMLPADISKDAKVKRFLEEAQIAGQLEHPNIVPVHEIGIDEDARIYFTMKLVQGEDLEAVMLKCARGDQEYLRQYSLGALIQLFMKVCDGVGFAHSRGVLHRDLKPENIMVGAFGEVLVMDWGIAKVLGKEEVPEAGTDKGLSESVHHARTLEGKVMGTPAYMSPEQALGQISKLDRRSDVFSLGGVLYKILTYQAPYQGRSAIAQLKKAQDRDLIAPDLRAPQQHIPPELNAICLKAMAYERSERYADTLELKNDLQLYLDGKSVSAKKDSLAVRTKKWIIRNKVAAMGIGAAAICLVAGIIAATMYADQKRQEQVVALLQQGQAAGTAGQYEVAEETFFAVLGLDGANQQAREGIARVSGKALAVKNKRLAKEKVKEADQLFAEQEFIKAYDAYVATFALDPELEEARQGIKIAAVKAEKQRVQARIKPVLEATRAKAARQQELAKRVEQLKGEMEQLRGKIKGYDGFAAKKPFWDVQKNILAAKIEELKAESGIISNYLTVLSHDGENQAARKALSQIYYAKFTAGEARQDDEAMAYYKTLILTFDDGYYQGLLAQDGSLSLHSTPAADAYYIYRLWKGRTGA